MIKNEIGRGERASWGSFPRVIRNDDLKTLSNHSEYLGAKSGDTEAAISLISKTLKQETVAVFVKIVVTHT